MASVISAALHGGVLAEGGVLVPRGRGGGGAYVYHTDRSLVLGLENTNKAAILAASFFSIFHDYHVWARAS